MVPSQLTAVHFKSYPPQAREVALAHLSLLRQMPLSLLPSVLRELIEYDFKFPAERREFDAELNYLTPLPAGEQANWFAGFAAIRLSAAQESFDWVNRPLDFSEQLSAYLWSTHQMDAFRQAATAYGDRMRAAVPPQPPAMRRLGIAVIGQGVASYDSPLFHNLRVHGTYFTNVRPERGLEHLLQVVADRTAAHPEPYAHWYVDGGSPAEHSDSFTCVSYAGLAPVRDRLLVRIQAQAAKPGMGPEELRDTMARLSPADLGLRGDPVLDRFQVKLLTEGSGTQIFSTTFVQWTAREVLRRSSALTLLVRFAPRQRQRPMNELLSRGEGKPELDPLGSLIDADMAAYYHWINQQRLPGSAESAFLVWFEGQNEALVVAPSLPRGTESKSAMDLHALLSLATT